jgi:hypothetical protein
MINDLLQYIENTCYAMSAVTSGGTVRVGHRLINSYGKGEQSDEMVTGEDQYPRAFLEYPIQVTYPNKGYVNYSMALVIHDKELDNRSNEYDKLKLCSGIIDDLQVRWKEDSRYNNYQLGKVNLLSLTEYGDDYTAGWRMEFDFTIPLSITRCDSNFYVNTPMVTCPTCSHSSCDCAYPIISGGQNLYGYSSLTPDNQFQINYGLVDEVDGLISLNSTTITGDDIVSNLSLTTSGAMFAPPKYINTDYTVQPTDHFLLCQKNVGVTIPYENYDGRIIWIKDMSGEAANLHIVVDAAGNTIDGNNGFIIDANYMCIGLIYSSLLGLWSIFSKSV